MSEKPRGWRDNAFLIAAVALPLVVVGLFLVASAVPRWTVEPPGYDLLLRADAGYTPAVGQVVVTVRVVDEHVVADIQPALPNSYPSRPSLYLFDHATNTTSEVALDLPAVLAEGETSRVIPVAALAHRRVMATTTAPDGYAFELRNRRGPGLIGDLFGMGRYDAGAAVVKNGRVVRIALPSPQTYGVQAVGWLAEPETR